MSTQVLLAFMAACVLLALTPGPNMALMIANTLRHGLRGGLVTLAGTTTGLALLVAAAAAGMTSIMVFMSSWFDAVRWAGAVYLVYLGARQLWQLRGRYGQMGIDVPPARRGNWYLQGLIVSLSNPKFILFLGAFLPQFVGIESDPVGQLTALAYCSSSWWHRSMSALRWRSLGRGPPWTPLGCASSMGRPVFSLYSAAWRWR
jgi:homoserine/homoserine lactone efflux protein